MPDPQQSNGSNGYDPDMVNAVIGRLDGLYDELKSEKGQYMERCRRIRDEIKDVLQGAKDNEGIPKKALRLVIKERQLAEKLEDLRADLEQDERDSYQQLMLALGEFVETPLGAAAAQAARMAEDEKRRTGGRRRRRKDTDSEEAEAEAAA